MKTINILYINLLFASEINLREKNEKIFNANKNKKSEKNYVICQYKTVHNEERMIINNTCMDHESFKICCKMVYIIFEIFKS